MKLARICFVLFVLASMLFIGEAILLLPVASMAFEPPNSDARRAAVGDLSGLPNRLQRAFAADSPAFDPIPKPGPNDWLSAHEEANQSFEVFNASHPNRPTRTRRIIYLQPFGEFTAGQGPLPRPVRWPRRSRVLDV